jgi:outer membrane protein OmpA-like peptidoglycan-associated protein
MTNKLGNTLLFASVFLFFLAFPLSAQTAQKVENLLNQEEISWQDAAIFALEASEKAVLDNPYEAFQFASSAEMLPKNIEASNLAKFDGISLLLMKAFDLKGGLFYTIFKNSHYAYRELVYKDIIQGKNDPEMTVSGQEFLFMINRILAITENNSQTVALEPEIVQVQAEPVQTEQEKLAEEINIQLETQQVMNTRARVTEEGVTISLNNIQFLANSADLTDSEKAKIGEIAEILKNVPERNLLVTGHTALAGTADDQVDTSYERAQSVANYIISLGTRTRAEVMIQGFGSERPIADNDTEEGKSLNRRVEITILLITGTKK